MKLTKSQIEKKVIGILSRARKEPRFQAQRERVALIDAIRLGHTEIAHSLLAHGVNPNSKEPKGRSALWYAAHWGRGTLVHDLIRRGASLPEDVLMGPVQEGDPQTVRFLIRQGANVNCVSSFTKYSYKFPEKRVLLTESIIKVPMSEPTKPALSSRRYAVVPKKDKVRTPPTVSGDLESIPIMLIKAGANVNRLAFEYSIFGGFVRTILGLAAHRGLVRTVRAMLTAGADVNQSDTWGGTPLYDAAQAGHLSIVKSLLSAGANVEVKRRDGNSPVSIARDKGFTDVAEIIAKHVNKRNRTDR